MRHTDPRHLNFLPLRRPRDTPESQVMAAPGNVFVPRSSMAIAAVVSSSIVVTVYDPKIKRGGLCHFIRPRPPSRTTATALYGLSATLAILQEFINEGAIPKRLKVGMYGGACPEWATPQQRQIAQENIEIVREVMKRKGITIFDEDVGGSRGRKILFLTGSNEIAIIKTDAIRRTDWFPSLKIPGAKK